MHRCQKKWVKALSWRISRNKSKRIQISKDCSKVLPWNDDKYNKKIEQHESFRKNKINKFIILMVYY
ncbi:hypothetical protein AKG39_05785 [Acetobacterium bakii]|uniref:Uncharacterized protein n=1 Tax=Acetobacterium bakii TaxID=52689 RepID=A0A0L6U2R6_9FIRM|nr:hypothetical protein AKG39_05785 [Acetobacterium bakii]